MTGRQFEDHARIKEVVRTVVKQRAVDAISVMLSDVGRDLAEQNDFQTMDMVFGETMKIMEAEVDCVSVIWDRLAETTQRLKYSGRRREP